MIISAEIFSEKWYKGEKWAQMVFLDKNIYTTIIFGKSEKIVEISKKIGKIFKNF